jgi:MFS family permease
MASRFTGLWRHSGFLKLWVADAVSVLGSQVTTLALPLTAALVLGATPAQMGMLGAAQYAPAVVVGLFAGVWVDRSRRRPLMVAADLGRALLLAAIPLAALAGALRIELLYAVAFGSGALGVLFATARGAHLPSLVERAALVEANGKLSVTGSVGLIAGPGLAGLLVRWLSAPVALVADALSFVVSGLLVGAIRADEPPPATRPARPSVVAEAAEGVRVLAREPVLRAFVLSSATLDVGWNALMAVYLLYLARELGQPATTIGLIFGVGSAGALAAGAVAGRIAARLGLGRTLVGSQLVVGLGGLGRAAPHRRRGRPEPRRHRARRRAGRRAPGHRARTAAGPCRCRRELGRVRRRHRRAAPRRAARRAHRPRPDDGARRLDRPGGVPVALLLAGAEAPGAAEGLTDLPEHFVPLSANP